MSTVSYNGQLLGFILTTELSEEPQTDPSGSDQMYNLIRLRVTSLLTGYISGPTYVPPAKATEGSAAAVCARLQHELSLVRRPLTFSENGVNLIELPDGRDEVNGPTPFGVTVISISPGSYLINWGVELRLSTCVNRSKNAPPPLVLSNRWNETATIDDKWLTTYRRVGKIVFSGRAGVNPDDYRQLVTPPLRVAFRRETAEYAMTPDGLSIAYLFVDKELMVVPPFPAVKASGRQSMTAVLPGAVRYGQLDLRLEGPAGVEKKDLYDAALRIGLSRALAGGLKKQAGGNFIVGGGVVEDLFDNAVELSMRWLVQPKDEKVVPPQPGILAAFLGGIVGGVLLNFGGNNKAQNPPAPDVAKPDPPDRPGVFEGAVLGLGAGVIGRGLGAIADALGLDPNDPEQWFMKAVPGKGGAANLPPWLVPGVLGGGPAVAAGAAGQPADAQLDVPTATGLTVPVTDWLGLDMPGVSDQRGIAPPLRGTADSLRLVATVLKDPCLQELVEPQNDPGNDTPLIIDLKAVPNIFGVPAIPPLPSLTDTGYDDDTDGAYEHFTLTAYYTWDEGVHLQKSTAGKGGFKSILNEDGTAAEGPIGYETPDPHPAVRMYNPTLSLRVEITAKRVGGQPVLPDPRSSDGNAVFMGGTAAIGGVDLAADGVSPVFTLSAIWNYKFLKPNLANTLAPLPPFMSKKRKVEAKLAAALAAKSIVFYLPEAASPEAATNIFTGAGVETVDDDDTEPAPGQSVP
jgi:hypothetical protein